MTRGNKFHARRLSAEYVRDRLSYDPDTGSFTWKIHAEKSAQWNGRWAGCPAGTYDGRGYRSINIDRRLYKAHRLAWLIVHGSWPAGDIDHINGMVSDNRISNLRDVSHKTNGRNAKLSSANSSGHTGVCWDHRTGKWMAYIAPDGHHHFLGRFSDKQSAVRARKQAEAAFGYHPNHGRRP